MFAAREGHAEMVRALLELGASVRPRMDMAVSDAQYRGDPEARGELEQLLRPVKAQRAAPARRNSAESRAARAAWADRV